jgi:hypothetical protein
MAQSGGWCHTPDVVLDKAGFLEGWQEGKTASAATVQQAIYKLGHLASGLTAAVWLNRRRPKRMAQSGGWCHTPDVVLDKAGFLEGWQEGKKGWYVPAASAATVQQAIYKLGHLASGLTAAVWLNRRRPKHHGPGDAVMHGGRFIRNVAPLDGAAFRHIKFPFWRQECDTIHHFAPSCLNRK